VELIDAMIPFIWKTGRSDHMRIEHDALGTREVPDDALYGIHTVRAVENFGEVRWRVHERLIEAFGDVKLACARTNHRLGFLTDDQMSGLEIACERMSRGDLNDSIIIDGFQGGAGTSTNMNVNEVLANVALTAMGHAPGEYAYLHPLDHVNLHQSTNDTYPTALRVATVRALRTLTTSIVRLQESFQTAERRCADVVKVGRTEMQDAVLVTLGREMGAYAEAFTRDRWRMFKCEERIRSANLGGTAVGTGITAPRKYIFQATEELRGITGLHIARSENLVEATQNQDAFVEVAGMTKALAANLIKVGNDLRLLSSGPRAGFGEIRLPELQEGSSIMPGKVNPVMPEMAVQAGIAVYGYENMIAMAIASGSLELNAFMPIVAYALLNSLELLDRTCERLARLCVDGIEANDERCNELVDSSLAAGTALVPLLGHERTSELVRKASETGRSLRDVVIESGLISDDQWSDLTSPERVNALGTRTPKNKQNG
jgi:aspartate ammonia-lyase